MSEQVVVPSGATREEAVMLEADSGSQTSIADVILAELTVGQELRSAREAKGMSTADVAKALKLSVHQVVALEADDWSRLPVTVIRGFVRNYARLLKLDPEPLMQALTALQMPPPPKLDLPEGTRTTLREAGSAERRDYAAVFSGLVLVLIAVLAYFFVPQDFWQSKLMELMAGQKPSVTTPESATPTTAVALPAQSTPPDSVPVAASAVLPEANAPTSPIQQSGSATSGSISSSGLKLSFSQPSWVEIRDRSGQIIFSQLNPAGSQRDIEGQPPFALVIGNATNVTVQYKGKIIELSQRSKDDVARLNLD